MSENCEKTEVIYGIDNIIKRAIEGLSRIRKTEDSVFASNGLSAFLPIQILKNQYQLLKERGARIRFITDITKEDISYCKEAMKFAELRHLDGIKGNFAVHDRVEYTAIATLEKAGSPTQRLIYSNVKEIVEQHQYLFETLWNKAILAEQKIREIEEGVEPDFIETINNPQDIQQLEAKLVNSAEQEILIIFPTANTFHRQEDSGPIQLLKQLGHHLIKPELTIRIMTPADYRIKDTVLQLKEKFKQNIDIQYIQQSFETTASILVVDRKYSLSIEVRDDTKDIFNDLSIGLATYSNSTSTVLSYASIFESLWRQADIYEQLKESKIQLNDAQSQLQDMKQYVRDVLKEVHRYE